MDEDFELQKLNEVCDYYADLHAKCKKKNDMSGFGHYFGLYEMWCDKVIAREDEVGGPISW